MNSMYQRYFGLTEAPFSIVPAPRYVYMSQRHQEALAHLLYGINSNGGFVLLTGEVGTGKTTVCRCLLEQVPKSCDIAYIFNPRLTVEELLSTICVEFGIAYPPGNSSIKVFVDCINTHLLEAHANGQHAVLIIDEAQNLSAEVLEQMRLLTNLETSERKLLQIILLGQPELAAMLQRPELRQLAQRIVARYHLGPLTKQEVAAYVRHRLDVAGTQRQLFPRAVLNRVYRLTGGIPRIINVLCDRALLGTYVQGKERVDRTTLAQAAREVFNRPTKPLTLRHAITAGVIVLMAGVLAPLAYQQGLPKTKTTAIQQTVRKLIAPPAVWKTAGQAKIIEPAFPEKLEWPSHESRELDEAMAYNALFREWGAVYKGTDPCREALNLGLRCRTARGGLNEVRQFNRPVVLRMRDDRGDEFNATLTSLDSKSATFALGSRTVRVAIGTLATQWSGYYRMLWRVPPVVPEYIRAGERGPAVAWLRSQLAMAEGGAAEPTGKDPVFDDVMARQVKQFQLAQGLIPVGTVGPQTLIRLAGMSDHAAPTLVHETRAK
jgi:general secretion pathway protein A